MLNNVIKGSFTIVGAVTGVNLTKSFFQGRKFEIGLNFQLLVYILISLILAYAFYLSANKIIDIVMDLEVSKMYNFVVGANQNDYHYINVNCQDFNSKLIADIKLVKEYDKCPNCGFELYFKKGIEIGNIFKLGTKYSQALNLQYLDEKNQLHPVVMGSYGIGLGRIMSSIVEQKSDDDGIVWPLEIAPFKVAIVLINENANTFATELYNALNKLNIDVILDDRDERPGVKFKDMDLIGIPLKVTLGKHFDDNKVELKLRTSHESIVITKEEVLNKIQELLKKND